MAVIVLLSLQPYALAAPVPAYQIVSGEMVNQPSLPEHIKDPEISRPGEECNCYAYTKNRIPNLPSMASIAPNSEPTVGAVAVEYFGRVKHVSIVIELKSDGVIVKEANYDHCKKGTRFIPFDHYSLVGFWK